MPSSWVDVANSALVKIGTGIISGFNDLNKAEKLTKVRYPFARDVVLRMHPWNCATNRVTSAPLTSPVPPFEYDYYHAQPADCLRILNIGPDGVDYKVEGRMIATNDTLLEIKYIKREENPMIIDELCAECIALYLAWDLCEAFQQTGDKKEAIWKDFRLMLPLSKSVDGKEDPAQGIEADLWLQSRVSDQRG